MYRALDRVARKQHGLATTAQFQATGFSHRQLAYHHERGAFDRVRRSVYRLAGAPITWEQAIHAACLAAGKQAVASHMTAAAIWQFRHSNRNGGRIHLTAPRQLRLAGIASHTIFVGHGDATTRGGIPVTTAERTIIDLAGTLTLQQLGETLDDALRRRLVDLERLRRLVVSAAARGGRRLLRPLHQLLAERVRGYQAGGSEWENDQDRLWDALGLPPGVRQHPVLVNGHTVVLDRAIPELKIAGEWDSFKYHHLPTDTLRDAVRTAELTAEGWHVISLTSSTNAEMIRRAVGRIVRDRQRWMARTAGQPPPDRPPQGTESFTSDAHPHRGQ